MSAPGCTLITTLITADSVMMCTNATAFDASVSDLEWHYPQIPTPETGEIQ